MEMKRMSTDMNMLGTNSDAIRRAIWKVTQGDRDRKKAKNAFK